MPARQIGLGMGKQVHGIGKHIPHTIGKRPPSNDVHRMSGKRPHGPGKHVRGKGKAYVMANRPTLPQKNVLRMSNPLFGSGKPVQSVRKPKRRSPGTVALREIRKLQATTDIVFAQATFNRMVRDIFQKCTMEGMRVTAEARAALMESAQAYLVDLFGKANRAAIHARRVTVMIKDVSLVHDIREDPYEDVYQH